MGLSSYERIKKEKKLVFAEPTAEALKMALFDRKSDLAYRRTCSPLNSPCSQLPKYLQRKLQKKSGILEQMRQSEDSDNDLGLPEINETGRELTLSSNRAVSLLSPESNVVGRKPEDAFVNGLIVPKQQSKSAVAHSNWKMFRVLVGHTGQVTSVTFDPQNEYFVTGSSDRTIKIWDLASGELRHTLTGHIMAVRGLVISDRHPYMFSCSEDKTVKCWDLETNKVIRDYHGHLSSVYTIDIHPTLDLIVTGGRDSSVKVWDIRTRVPVYTLTGHKDGVNKVCCRSTDPQIVSCSMDSTVRTWDLVAGKCDKTLTYHSKSVRSFCCDDTRDEFISGSADGIRKFSLPGCDYLQELESLPHDQVNEGNLILNTNCCNNDGVMFMGCDNGQYGFWDWESGTVFQQGQSVAMPGSLESEKGILCSSFDRSGIRLVTGNVDKSIKIWRPVE